VVIAELDNGGLGNILDFTLADANGFDVIGPMPALAANDSIVIYNLASSGTVANAYSGDNRGAYSSSAGNTITLSPAKQFPYPSPGKRFQVVQHAVTYECNPTTGQLRRYWDYGIPATQDTPPTTPNSALLATGIATGGGVPGCSITYTASSERTSVVGLALRIERNGEFVRLFQQVHVNNAP
jgi:MSHA biogenesis protein MshO